MSRFGHHETDLVAALVAAFPNHEELGAFTSNGLGQNLDTISAPGTLNKRVADLIEWACRRGRERELLRAAATQRPQAESLQITISNCTEHLEHTAPEPWYRSSDPFAACILKGKRALFNRDGLRRHMRELLTGQGANVLVVRGERGSGCSHSLQLIVHLEAELQAFKVVYVDLETLGRDAAPDDVIRYMAARLMCSFDSLPPQHGQAASWNIDLCGWFTAQVDSREQETWVVIDGLDHGPARNETTELLKQLAVMAENETQKLRMVFLGFPHTLPGHVESVVMHEQIEELGDETLDEFFTRFFLHMDQGADPQAVTKAAEAVRALAGEEPEGRLRRLSENAVRVAKQLATPPESN